MKIYDLLDQEITFPGDGAGRLLRDRLLIARHPAAEALPEQSHEAVTAVYPNGGRVLERVIDSPGREARAAWDEYADIFRFVPWTEAELTAIRSEQEKLTPQDQTDVLLVDHELRLTLLELGVV